MQTLASGECGNPPGASGRVAAGTVVAAFTADRPPKQQGGCRAPRCEAQGINGCRSVWRAFAELAKPNDGR